MELKEILSLNAEGLIPGPGESEEAFKKRVEKTKATITRELGAEWHWASEQLRQLFDFSPRWCAISRSKRGLTPWQAAATWIDENQVCSIQLNPSRFVQWLVDQKEIVSHEAAHAARAAFDEPHFEELFAYLTADRAWRRVLGPLFRTPREALFLLGFCLFGASTQLIELSMGCLLFSQGWFLLALLSIFFWSLRLFRSRIRLQRAYQQLAPLVRDPTKIRAVLFRLTDHEIETLARGDRIEAPNELRWDLIKAAYLRDDVGLWLN